MVINNKFNSINNINRIGGANTSAVKRNSNQHQRDFAAILEGKILSDSALKFSKHASMRLQTRNIHLTSDQKDRISKGLDKAEEKGVRDSLVMMDDIAFVVNVKNKTVITALSSSELKENVFTNIDGAIFT